MEELIYLKRSRGKNGQFLKDDNIGLRFDIKDGRFVLFSNLISKLQLKSGDAVMFAISKKDKCLLIFKEELDEDNYIIKKAGGQRSYSRFTAKFLANDIVDYLELNTKIVAGVKTKTEQKSFFFEIGDFIGNKLKLTPKQKQELK